MRAIVFLTGWLDDGPRPFVVECPANATPGNCWQHEKRHHLAQRRLAFSIDPRWSIHKRINERADGLHRIGANGRRNTPPHWVYPDYAESTDRLRRAIARHGRRHPQEPRAPRSHETQALEEPQAQAA